MKVAVEGCSHGELDAIYSHIQRLEAEKKCKVDLLLICGDFEAIRDNIDLETMAVPPKYKRMGDFHKYFTGQATAPLLTVVIGGNHEASNHLWELYHGGWLAPNIYFLGYAGCVQVNGVRIAGASGIFKQHDYHRGHFERQPYDNSTKRSIYHIREYNVRRLSLLSSPDVFLSHDWPSGIEQHGNLTGLLRRKPFLRGDIQSKQLGSPPLMNLLRNLKPAWWFAAHLHTRFEACVRHDPSEPPSLEQPPPVAPNPDEIAIPDEDDGFDALSGSTAPRVSAAPQNPDEITLDDEIETVAPPALPPRETRFLALDKCLPRRQFLEIVDIPSREETDPSSDGSPVTLSYDPEWLAITRAFQPYLSRGREQSTYPDLDAARTAIAREWDWVHEHVSPKLGDAWRVDACQHFTQGVNGAHQQTEAFAALLEMENVVR
ncbi:lariat debranching enzyme, C-terminal domain-containing protein [Lactifluus subvellereus]|nr:lariat debranching enzyme, C-terminal domain-containing protein [Lactifluus subvellereus]